MIAGERRLAAIMFVDLVGFTKMAQERESVALQRLEEFRGLLRAVIAGHSGTEVKTIGDALLVEFKSALDAALCSVDIQRSLERRNAAAGAQGMLQARIGIHLGDVVHKEGDVLGDAVNVASRIEPLAAPGGICISQQVYDNIRNKTDLGLTKLGDVELKNVQLPMGVYKVDEPGAPHMQERGAPRERLAVLPFVNISPDPNDEYFADGLTEELINKLSEVNGLKVIARTSVMNYKKKEKTASEIGRELNVGSIIEGSVRKAGNRVRVTVQLVDSGTEEHLWASNYDKELDDIFAIQSDVAAKVATSVSAGLFAGKKSEPTKDVEAYSLYLRGTQLFHERKASSVKEALLLFRKAVKRDPKFAKAYAGASQALLALATMGEEEYDVAALEAESAAARAIEIDPLLAEGHAAMAGVNNLLDRFDGVVVEAEEAVRLNPNLSEAHLALGIAYSSLGRLDRGVECLEKAYELDPLSQRTAGTLASVLLVTGRAERAKEIREMALQLEADNTSALIGLAEYFMFEEEYAKALQLLGEVVSNEGGELLARIDSGLVYALTGRREEALRVLEEMKSKDREASQLYGQVFVYSALGDLDDAFRALDRAAELHSWPFLIGSLPVFENLRKDPRYKEFEERVGLRQAGNPRASA